MPPASWSSACSSVSVSPSARRRHVAQATAWRFTVVLIAGRLGTDLHRLYKEPRAHPRTQAVPNHLPRNPIGSKSTRGGLLPHLRQPQPPPWPRPFPCHQGLPISTLSTRNPLTPRESVPLLNLDRDSPWAKSHFFRRPPSAAELAAGSSVHPRGRNNHRSNRLDPLSPRVTSVYRAVPPFAGEHRRSPAPLSRAEEEEGSGLVKPDQWARRAHCQ